MRCSYSNMTGAVRIERLLVYLILPAIILVSPLLRSVAGAAQDKANALVAVDVQASESTTAVKLETSETIGSKYTVYDSFDPVRVVIDFPGLDVSGVAKEIPGKGGLVKEVRVSSFDLTSGKLGRVELILTAVAKYQVDLEGKNFSISFDTKSADTAPESSAAPLVSAVAKADTASAPPLPTTQPASSDKKVVAAATTAETTTISPAVMPASVPGQGMGNIPPAREIDSLKLVNKQAIVQMDGAVGRYQYFKLATPPRLVVDVYGVRPQFKERSFAAMNGIKLVRVGVSADKTRLVFDASSLVLPDFKISAEGKALTVTWGDSENGGAGESSSETNGDMDGVTSPRPVEIESVDFDVKDGKSLLSVGLSGPGELIPVAAKGTTLGFGIKNATITSALRRTLDASAFPSAVKRVTPYTVLVGDGQDVRFAVELKGAVDYSLRQEGKRVLLTVDNQTFGQNQNVPGSEVLPVPVPVAMPTASTKPASEPQTAVSTTSSPKAETAAGVAPSTVSTATASAGIIGATPPQTYSGQKITLVFDDADILNILQLIAEVSNLNIIASDDVKGTITLRLIDVPWDQALALIMDIKDLGMVRQGNVVRIMPKEKLRAMEEARMNASRTREKLEDLETELITVNYADLASVSKHVEGVLTKDRAGVSVSQDTRNKQLIVRDIPSNLRKIKDLVKKLDTPERQVMIEARIVEATSTFSRDLGVSWGFSSEAEHRTSELANNQFNLGLGGSFLITPPSAGSVLDSAGMAAGFTFGKVGSTSLDLRLSALEASGEGKVISTPRISTLNGEQALISQGTKIPYQSTGTDGTKTEFVDANLELSVTPVINPDNSMILDITATDSAIGSYVNTGVVNASAPSVDTREAKTKLLVRDGETTVIGGIFVETDTQSESGVPWLMKVPFIGHLFESTNKSNQRAELLIFITPHIVE